MPDSPVPDELVDVQICGLPRVEVDSVSTDHTLHPLTENLVSLLQDSLQKVNTK